MLDLSTCRVLEEITIVTAGVSVPANTFCSAVLAQIPAASRVQKVALLLDTPPWIGTLERVGLDEVIGLLLRLPALVELVIGWTRMLAHHRNMPHQKPDVQALVKKFAREQLGMLEDRGVRIVPCDNSPYFGVRE